MATDWIDDLWGPQAAAAPVATAQPQQDASWVDDLWGHSQPASPAQLPPQQPQAPEVPSLQSTFPEANQSLGWEGYEQLPAPEFVAPPAAPAPKPKTPEQLRAEYDANVNSGLPPEDPGAFLAQSLQYARDDVAAEDKRRESESWGNATARKLTKRGLPFISTIMDAARLDSVIMSANKINAGEAGHIDYDNVARWIAETEAASKDGMGSQIADTVAMMPAFMGELMMTGGAFTGARAAVEGGAKKLLGKAAENTAAKAAAKVAATAAASAALSAANPQGAIRSTFEEQLDDTLDETQIFTDETGKPVRVKLGSVESFASALPKGFADATIEVGTEMIGGELMAGAGKVVSKIPGLGKLGELRRGVVARWLGRTGNTISKLEEHLKEVGWNGIIGEALEERAGDVARIATGLQDAEENPTGQLLYEAPLAAIQGDTERTTEMQRRAARQLMIEGAAFGVVGGAAGAAEGVANRFGKPQTIQQQSQPEQVQQPPALPPTQPQPSQRPAFDVTTAEQWAATNPSAAAAMADHIAKGRSVSRGYLEKVGVPNAGGSSAVDRADFARRVAEHLTQQVQPQPEETPSDPERTVIKSDVEELQQTQGQPEEASGQQQQQGEQEGQVLGVPAVPGAEPIRLPAAEVSEELRSASLANESGFSNGNGTAVAGVKPSVVAGINQFKILDPVISLIPVDVVNMLGGKEATADVLLKNPAVLVNHLSVMPLQDIRAGLPAAFDKSAGLIAGVAAKLDPVLASDISTAVSAVRASFSSLGNHGSNFTDQKENSVASKSPAGWGAVKGDVPKPAPTVGISPAASKGLASLRKHYAADGYENTDAITPVEPRTDAERDAIEFLRARGREGVFVAKPGDPRFDTFAGMSHRKERGVVFMRSGMQEHTLWRTVGHELAHATGFDEGSKADEDLIRSFAQKRLEKSAPGSKYRVEMEQNGDTFRREGVAELVGSFMSDPQFREQVRTSNPNLFTRIRDAVLKLVGKMTPRDAAAREVLEWLRKTEAEPAKPKRTGLKKAVAVEAPAAPVERSGLKKVATLEPSQQADPQQQLATWVADELTANRQPSRDEFFARADQEFGGGRTEGKYGDSQAYDALELGVNKFLATNTDPTLSDRASAKANIQWIEEKTAALPRHKARTGEKDTLQQFSTPPAYSYLVNWVANISPRDVVLEPSGGIGGLAIHAKNAGATVYANEIDESRAKLLRQLGLDGVFTEDAEHVAAILSGKMPAPSVVVMNPPFSRAGRRLGDKKMPGTDRKHIDESLRFMEPGGRLVAIIGAGLHGRGKAFDNWMADLPYAVRADIEIDRDVYKGHGTTFPTRLLVIDKVSRVPGEKPVSGSAATLADAVDMLEGVRNERQSKPTESSESQSTESAQRGQRSRPASSVQPAVDAVDTGKSTTSSPESSSTVPSGAPASVTADVGLETDGNQSTPRKLGRKSVVAESNADDAGDEASGKPAREPVTTDAKPADSGNTADVETSRRKESRKRELSESAFEAYEPVVQIKGAKKHPASIVESAAMAAIDPPPVEYRPKIEKKIVEGYTDDDGKKVGVSDVQLEAVAMAGQAHSQKLPDGTRRGFMIGDGTGVGKAREIAAIILDNWNRGTKKAVWVSKNAKLYEPARDEWSKVGGDPEKVFGHADIGSGLPIDAKQGILFTTYSTLKQTASDQAISAGNARSRTDQVVDWLGPDFDGVVIFDESHEMGSAIERGSGLSQKKASAKALAGIDLQDRLPNAKIVYLSATSATEVANLAYAGRLGLWGDGTPFPNREQFVDKITAGGVAAMEKVAADMKAMGMYVARNIAFNDGTEKGTVTYDRIEHTLTEDQSKAYKDMSEAWQLVFRNMDAALEITGAIETKASGAKVTRNPQAVARARSNFWSANQRFWNQVITAMQTPAALKQIERSLDSGHSVIVQLTNTNEAAQARALAGREKDQDLDDVDVSPRYILMDYIDRSFPTTMYEEYQDENGNIRSRPVVDSKGNPVRDPQAVEMKEKLLDQLGSLQVADRGALDMIVDRFGEDQVAEVTGRSERIIKKEGKAIRQRRGERASKADIAAFMDGRKRVLIFSEAGGTGASYHADLSRKNQQPRDHILLQPGWRADAAVQGLGRSHRSNQAQAPKYFLVQTNLKGQKRFISTIARRLSQLGALTKGQRSAGEAGVFSPADNLESTEAHEALTELYHDIHHGTIDFLNPQYLEQSLGLVLRDKDGNLKAGLPPITQFLNRVLSLPVDEQNRVFDEFQRRLDAKVEQAMADGTLDQGMETVRADKITKVSEQVVYRHPSGAETKHVVVNIGRKTKPVSYDAVVLRIGSRSRGFVTSERTGKVWAVEDTGITQQTDDGRISRKYKLHSPINAQYTTQIAVEQGKNWQSVSDREAKANWNEQLKNVPELHEEETHILSGVLLPIWDRMPEANAQVKRLLTDDGEQILGRVIPNEDIRGVLKKLGASIDAPKLTPKQAIEAVEKGAVLELANGWKVKRSRVEGEWSIEVVGPDYSHQDELQRAGAFSRRIDYKLRHFIPSGEKAADALAAITESRPITDVIRPGSGGGGGGGAAFAEPAGGQAHRQTQNPKNAVITKGVPSIMRPVPLVELTKLARTLLQGNHLQVVRKMRALGYFSPASTARNSRIRIRADQAEDYNALAGVLAHEAGHLIDYLPHSTLTRGNILGRLASLRKYLKQSIALPSGTQATRKEITKELLKLSKWWRGAISKSQQKYRRSSRELYADALSVLLNSPGDLQRRAPKFFNAFIEYLDKKPEVRDSYLAVQDLLAGTPEQLAETRRKDIREAYGRGEEIWKARQAEIDESKQNAFEFLRQTLLDSSTPVLTREQKAPVPWHQSLTAKHALEELSLSRNALHLWAKKVHNEVTKKLAEHDIDRMAAGEYMMMRRIADGDRGGVADQAQKLIMQATGKSNWPDAKAEFIATMSGNPNAEELLNQALSAKINPQGYSPESARSYLDNLKVTLGKDAYDAMESAVARLHELGWQNVLEAAKVGSYDPDMVSTTLAPNKDTYAPFLVLKYLDSKVKAGIFKQVGTFEDIANPFDAFLMKNLSLIRLNELQKAKKEAIKVLDASGDLGAKQKVDKYHRLRPPSAGKEHLMYLENGKLVAYEVEPYVARVFQSNDIGTLSRLAKWLSSSYRIFHPLWVGWNIGWQASNLVRDPFRTYVNAAVLRNDGSVPRQMLDAVVDMGRVPWNIVKAIPASWRRGFGWNDDLIDEMEEERAITTPFIQQQLGRDDLDQYDKILQETGVWEKPASRNAIIRSFELLKDGMESFGTFTETLTKVAMYNMATRKGLKGRERAYVVRNYAGTPNTRRRGLWVDLHNSVWMYSNVIMQGYKADAEVAFNPTTATGRWIRAGLTQYMPKALMIAAAAGLLGDALKELFDDISEHDKTKGIIIPLGRSDGKPIYLRLPHNDTDRVIAGMAWKLANKEGFDGMSEAFDLASGDLPGINIAIQLASKWAQFLAGKNPRDDFRGRDVIGQDEQKAGGWPRMKPMLLWTTDQFGEPGRLVRVFAEWNRNTFTGEETTTTEKIVNTTPGLSRLLRVSDRGSTEQQWDAVEKEDRDAAKLRLSMPQSVRDLNKERNRLIRLGPERLEESDRGRLAILNAWESGIYQPSREKIKANDNEADRKALESDTKQVVDSLDNRSAKLPEAILGTLVDHLTDPEPRRKLGEKRELYDARRKQHQETIALAAEALHSTGSMDATALRRALLALQKKRGHSTSTIEPNGNSTALGDRLNRIRQRLHAPIAVK